MLAASLSLLASVCLSCVKLYPVKQVIFYSSLFSCELLLNRRTGENSSTHLKESQKKLLKLNVDLRRCKLRWKKLKKEQKHPGLLQQKLLIGRIRFIGLFTAHCSFLKAKQYSRRKHSYSFRNSIRAKKKSIYSLSANTLLIIPTPNSYYSLRNSHPFLTHIAIP